MPKKLIVNAIEPREIRAAIYSNEHGLVNLFIERSGKKCQKGDIFKARVLSVESHLQAAFVEIEHGQHGFLSVSDLILPDAGAAVYEAPDHKERKPRAEKPSFDSEEIDPEEEEKRTDSAEEETKLMLDEDVGEEDGEDIEEEEEEEVRERLDSDEDSDDEGSESFGEPEKNSEAESEGDLGFSPDFFGPESSSAQAPRLPDDHILGDLLLPGLPTPDGEFIPLIRAEPPRETPMVGVDDLSEAPRQEQKKTEGKKAGSASADMGEEEEEEAEAKPRRGRMPPISEVLKVGQELVVQIIKEGIGKKAPVVSTYLSLPGRYLVMTVGSERHAISRKIRQASERDRLAEIVADADIPPHCGLIVRTAAVEVPDAEVMADIEGLAKFMREIKALSKTKRASSVLHREPGLITRIVRDYYDKDIDEVLVDTKEAFDDISHYFKTHLESEQNKLKLVEGGGIFEKYRLEDEVRDVFRSRVSLPGGGGLVLEQTEAMLTIDVNSGTYRGGKDDEETAFNLNMLAAKEVSRQVQLRDVGGLIMIDFIDMRRHANRRNVIRELEKAFKNDKAKINITRISDLGVLEMTRQRTRDSLLHTLHTSCSHCQGTGLVPSDEYVALGILRMVRENLPAYKGDTMKVITTAKAALDVLNSYRDELHNMEESVNADIQILIDSELPVGEFYLAARPRREERLDRSQGGGTRGSRGNRPRRGGGGVGGGERNRERDMERNKIMRNETSQPLGVIGASEKPAAAGSSSGEASQGSDEKKVSVRDQEGDAAENGESRQRRPRRRRRSGPRSDAPERANGLKSGSSPENGAPHISEA